MRFIGYAGGAVVALVLGCGTASAVNICRAGPNTCATTMPVGGYCECTTRGQTTDGTVEVRPQTRRPVNSSAGGCGANPNAPGCR